MSGRNTRNQRRVEMGKSTDGTGVRKITDSTAT